MTIAEERFDPSRQLPGVLRLRAHAAAVRTLLDEFERVTPWDDGLGAAAPSFAAEQLAEELASLASRMMECAAVVALLAADDAKVRTTA